MTDDPRTDHAGWDELAVGHALRALEPADEAAFLAHLRGCLGCARLVDETERTMADLATTAGDATPPPDLRGRILRAATADTVPSTTGASRHPARAARPRLRRELAAAAGVVLLALLGIGTWRLASGGSGHPTDVAARCADVHCPTAELTAGGRAVAQVMALDHRFYVRPTGLPPNDAARDEYVLWRVRPGAPPEAVGGFDVSGGSGIVSVGEVTGTLRGPGRLAVTREPGRTPPAAPSTPVLGAGTLA